MRKQTKLVAVFAAAALLAIGASMTSFAANGWTEEDGTWVYLDKDGYKVTDTWKKSGNFWYFLDEDGYMATSKLIDNGDDNGNIYYVDDTGRMVANRWVELENEDYYDGSDDNESETNWYYFQNSGKAYKTTGDTSFKTISGKKYAFDENGKMLYGWVGDTSNRITDGDSSYQTGLYYCGTADDGARVTSDWRKLYVGDQGPSDSEDDEYWFYFQTNGKKLVDNDAKKINGKYYAFDEFGVMISEWHESSEEVASELKGYYSGSDDGARKKGWFQAVPSSKINPDANADDSSKWFYGMNDGKLVTSEIKTINGKKYAFNKEGEMLSGLWALAVNDSNKIKDSKPIEKESEVGSKYVETVERVKADGCTTSVYYFGSGEDGAMKTGNQNVEVDGDSYQFAFGKSGESKGKGLKGLNNNIFYIYGKKIKADSDYRYQAIDEEDGSLLIESDAIGHYLVNTSGSVMKGNKYTDSEGRVYTLGDNDKVVSWEWKK